MAKAKVFVFAPAEKDRVGDTLEKLVTQGCELVQGDADWHNPMGNNEDEICAFAENADALTLLGMAERVAGSTGSGSSTTGLDPDSRSDSTHQIPERVLPDSFVAGRYQVTGFLGEGGRKQVYLAHDTRLDRDVAFAVIKTEGLDSLGHERIQREAQALGRLGGHPHIVTIFDVGEDDGAPTSFRNICRAATWKRPSALLRSGTWIWPRCCASGQRRRKAWLEPTGTGSFIAI